MPDPATFLRLDATPPQKSPPPADAVDVFYDPEAASLKVQKPDGTTEEIGKGDVASVNGQTGTVVLGKSDVGLGNVDNTSDANKPISTLTQTALDGKASIAGSNITNPEVFKRNLEIPEHQIAVATSDSSAIQNVTPLDDSELVLTVEANATYIVRGKFCGTSTGDFSVGGMRVALSGPTCQDIFLRYQKRCYGNINGAVAAQIAGQFFTTLTGEAIQLSGVATNVSVYEFELDGIFTVGISGGTLKVKFAQQNNGGAGLTRKSGSTFELLKL